MLKYVQVELYSKVPGGRWFKEGEVTNEATYKPTWRNPEYSPSKDLVIYIVVNPTARNSEVKIDVSY